MTAVVAALVLVCMVGFITFEILLRHFFSTSTFVQDEFLGYGLSICIVWSLGYTLESGKMIRINLLTTRLSARAERALMTFAAFSTALLILGLAWMFWLRVTRAWTRGTVSASSAEVPIWIPESIIMIGLILFFFQLVAHGLQSATNHPSFAKIDANDQEH